MNSRHSLVLAAALGLSGTALTSPVLADAGNEADLQQRIQDLEAKIEAMADMMDQGGAMMKKPAAGTTQAVHDHANAASGALRDRTFGIHGSRGSTTVGAYGEMHYSNLTDENGVEADKQEMDFHRFILFMGHEFNDRIRFWSELEVEHAYVEPDEGGEVAIEQAFMEFDLNPDMAARAGIMLIPVGFINETHEPPTFYGVERNNVAKYILPTTWREGGAGLTGRFGDGFSYDLMVHTGLQTSAGSNYAVRKGRKGVGNAPASDLATTARVTWSGVPGLQLGVAAQYQSDITQGADATAGSATLFSPTISWQISQFTLRGVYATWSLDGSGPASIGADEQTGWYLEPSWKVNSKLGLFARVSTWDNQVNSNTDTEYSQWDVGFNYWPHEDVVLKVDYQNQSAPAGKAEYDGFNLGIGYQF